MAEYGQRFAENDINLPDLIDQHLKEIGRWVHAALSKNRRMERLSALDASNSPTVCNQAYKCRYKPASPSYGQRRSGLDSQASSGRSHPCGVRNREGSPLGDAAVAMGRVMS
jgi:hypothetical protein